MHNVHVKNRLPDSLFLTSSLRFKPDRLITAVVIYNNFFVLFFPVVLEKHGPCMS